MNNLHNKQVTDIKLICISRSSNRSVLWCQAKVSLYDEVMMSQEFILTPPDMLQSWKTHRKITHSKLNPLFVSIYFLRVAHTCFYKTIFFHDAHKRVQQCWIKIKAVLSSHGRVWVSGTTYPTCKVHGGGKSCCKSCCNFGRKCCFYVGCHRWNKMHMEGNLFKVKN